MGNIVLEYFTDLYFASWGNYSSMVNLVKRQVTRQDNDRLLAHFSVDEFKRDIMHMHLDKFSRLNGMNLTFYQSSGILW